ncbi:MAG: phosphatidylglycerophosphatase A, partial [Burkholderiaceae bacterium]|nr:phosphatidylglycerophosphatase A [Burkholderiaceae bacterium]
MTDKNTIVMYLATGCKSGYSPIIPGTAGSLAALVPCWLLSLLPLSVSAMFLIAFIVLSIWAAELAENIVGRKDPGCIVIDEFAGMM